MKSLLIVESPSKCATIEKYLLSKNVKCIASFGHIRELKSLQDIDFLNTFNTRFTPISSKSSQIQTLKKAIRSYSNIILATDNDREGESIAWHICIYFGLDVLTTKRILFNDISEKSLIKAFDNPVTINLNLVQAQITRQIIDLIVGFKISPLLWKFGNKKLSAGRCQSPALLLICENQEIIDKQEVTLSYNVVGIFTSLFLPFTLKKMFPNTEDLKIFLKEIQDNKNLQNNFYFNFSINKSTFHSPSPFSTSSLQQSASNLLKFSPKLTMSLAQKLYEKGLITYMRTDSTSYCDDFLAICHIFIKNKYDERYINKNQKSQPFCETAHEAIRVTDISKMDISDLELEKKEATLYNFIWNNTIQSCMSDATYDNLVAEISDASSNYVFSYKTYKPVFLGWQIINSQFTSISIKNDPQNSFDFLKNIPKKTNIPIKKIIANPSFTQSTSHFTEATLISKLEKYGIGRPSTFDSIVDKIQERNYVKKTNILGKNISSNIYEIDFDSNEINIIPKDFTIGNENNKLVLNPLGKFVNGFLQNFFHELFNIDYTNVMEKLLDKIANNNYDHNELLSNFNSKMDLLITSFSNSKNNYYEYNFDNYNTLIFAKYGPVVKCIDNNNVSFKKIKDNINIEKLIQNKYSLKDILHSNEDEENINEQDDINGKQNNSNQYLVGHLNEKPIFVKKGKYGLFMIYDSKSTSLKEFGNRPLENISLEEVLPILQQKNNNIIREISENLFVHKGKNKQMNDYIFYKTKKMRKPKFLSLQECSFNYKTCDIDVLKEWIYLTYGISC